MSSSLSRDISIYYREQANERTSEPTSSFCRAQLLWPSWSLPSVSNSQRDRQQRRRHHADVVRAKRIINESTHVVQLVVKPASVADRLAGLIPPPEGRGRRLAVGAAGARPPRRALQRQFWKREDRDITPVAVAVTDDRARDRRLYRFNPSSGRNVHFPVKANCAGAQRIAT